MRQASLFDGGAEPGIDPAFSGLRRIELGLDSWLDHVPRWLDGHQALFDALAGGLAWRAERRPMYERIVDVPRLVAVVPTDGPLHPALAAASAALSARYGRPLDRVAMAWYRDGRDSVAWHGDRLGDRVGDAIVAILSVGAPRRFLLRPAAGGASRVFRLGWGDLLVMGGACQRHFQHAVPKCARAEPRMSIQLREGG